MEVTALFNTSAHHFSSCFLKPHRPSRFFQPSLAFKSHRRILSGSQIGTSETRQKPNNIRVVASTSDRDSKFGSKKGIPVSAFDGEVESELNYEEWIELLGDGRENCKASGLVEILECLAEEAITGDDEGRDPTDYNRRAQIFDKCSRVFQDLKERSSIQSPHGH